MVWTVFLNHIRLTSLSMSARAIELIVPMASLMMLMARVFLNTW